MKKQKWYFTFGFGQQYENCFIVIEAENYVEAREKMMRKFGCKWAFQYNESQWFRDGVSQQEEFNLREIS